MSDRLLRVILKLLLRKVRIVSTQVDQLTQDVSDLQNVTGQLQTSVGAIGNTLQQEAATIAQLQQQIAAGGVNGDISTQLSSLEQSVKNLQTLAQQAQALANPVTPPATGGDTTSASTTTSPAAGT